jgi:cytoskeletal protein CcmA (bactofilin family)
MTPGAAMEGQANLKGDLDALRSLVLDIKGSDASHWYEAAAQNLSAVHAAMVATGADAAFQGAVSSVGNASIGGTLAVTGAASLSSTLGVSGAATLSDSLSVAKAATFSDTVSVAGAATLSDALTVAGLADFNGGITANEIKIDGDSVGALYLVGASGQIEDSNKLSFDGSKLSVTGGVDVSGASDLHGAVHAYDAMTVDGAASLGSTLSVAGAATLSSTLEVVGVATLDAHVDMKASMSVTGSAEFGGGVNIMAGGLEIAGDKLEVTGSFAVKGDSALDGALSVSGAASLSSSLSVAGLADFNGDVTANKISIDGDVATRLYIVDSDGSIKDESGLTYAGGAAKKLSVTGALDISLGSDLHGAVHAYDAMTVDGAASMGSTLSVAGASDLTGNVHAYAAMTVDGAASFGDTLSVTGAASLSSTLTVSDLATFSNGIAVNGAAADFNADVTANKISIDGDVATRLYIVDADGSIKDESGLTYASAGGGASKVLSVTGDIAAVNAAFSGDVTVAGDLAVKGAMTYIETENLKVKDAIIHLATGSNSAASRGIVLHGNSAGGSGDLAVGAKAGGYDFVFAKNVDDSDVDAGNSEIFSTASLAGAWMSSVRLGSAEGTELGHVAVSGSDVEMLATGNINLSANGQAFSLAAAGDQAAFEAEFGVGTSLVSAIVSAASGGNFKKGSFDATAGQALLDFSSLGALRAGYDAEKDLDVYLNGVLLVASDDYALSNDHTVSLNYNFSAGDKMTIIIRNAA